MFGNQHQNCHLCKEYFPDEFTLAEHTTRVHVLYEFLLSPTLTEDSFENSSQCNPDTYSQNASEKPSKGRQCHICGKVCNNLYNLEVHQRTHEKLDHACLLCNKTFRYRRYLVRHKKSQLHTANEIVRDIEESHLYDNSTWGGLTNETDSFLDEESMQMKEDESDVEFIEISDDASNSAQDSELESLLLAHEAVQTVLTVEKESRCYVCNKTFWSRTNLNRHMRTKFHINNIN